MALYDDYPYTNFHSLNLDWIIKKLKELENGETNEDSDESTQTFAAVLSGNYPYTNFHALNLDWIIQAMTALKNEWDSFPEGDISATAHESAEPDVTVEGDLRNGLVFNFGLVRGLRGPQGPKGNDGRSFSIMGLYATYADLVTAHPTGNEGDAYAVGTSSSNTIYLWDTDDNEWVDIGALMGPQGVSVETIEFNQDYTMTITLSDGTTFTSQSLRGATGDTGPQGPTGTGITSITFNSDYTMTVTLTDGSVWTSGSLRGPQGEQGPQGETGYGIPPGGSAGNFLVKATSNDYDVEWSTLTEQQLRIRRIVIPSFSTLPQTFNAGAARISSGDYVIHYELSNPSAQVSDWTVTTTDSGTVTVSGTIDGSTVLYLYFARTA